jgi:mRNA interferase RelE/StbE
LYRIEFLKEALRDLKRVDKIWQKRILHKIKLLAKARSILENNIEKLKGEQKTYYRLRVGDYRIIYTFENNEMLILVIKIGHRRNIYL